MQPVYENLKNKTETGIQYVFCTFSDSYEPLHWHDELEILYYLNGSPDITIDGTTFPLPSRRTVVINSGQVHNTHHHDTASMFLCIHINLNEMEKYIPDIRLYHIDCRPDCIPEDKADEYLELGLLLEKITRLYMQEVPALPLESSGLILQVYAKLIRHFSRKIASEDVYGDERSRQRIRDIISYVEAHYQEPISLDDISGHMGLNKEYFCRFFKKNMGISFLQFLTEVRITNIYHDLLHTDIPISELMEKHGFQNQKLFNRAFKEIYGCPPSHIRKYGPKQAVNFT